MKFTSENATFFQSGFNFYIGNVVVENTIVFNEDYIVIGNLKSEKNVFAMGELIVIGDIECKSIYVTKDFFNVGNIVSEVVEVEGSTKTLDKSVVPNINIDKILSDENTDYKVDLNKKSELNETNKTHKDLDYGKILLKEIEESRNIKEIYRKYLSKKGDLVEGKVSDVIDNKVVVDLDDIKSYIELDNRHANIGMHIYAYIKSVKLSNDELNITLENNDRSYVTKIINRELSKNKYDLSKVYFKNIEICKDENIVVTILSDQLNDSSLNIIEQKISKYFYNKKVKLKLYLRDNNCKKDENNKSINKTIKNIENKNINGFSCGDKVLHNKFGEGKIINIIDLELAEIDFKGSVKTINIPILIKKGLIKKKEEINNKNTNETKANNYIETNKSGISVSESKKYMLVTGIVSKVGTRSITLKIDKNTIGVLERKDDIKENIEYHIGDEVIAYVSNIYMKNEKIELELIKNNSNYFKLLFQKYKEYLDVKNCNLKLCKYTNSIGALLIVDKKYKFAEQDMLIYIIQLMNKSAGINIVRVIDYVYDPYKFLSNIFDVTEKDISVKNGIYIVNNPKIGYLTEVNSICDEIEKITKYKVKVV